jgi:hypothetical protein
MTLVDERGRLFGRVNLIDAFAVLFVLVLIPVAYAAYLIFRVPPPTLTSVEPTVFEETPKPFVRIRGSNLLPYLSAYVAPAGEPLPRYLNNRAQSEATFLIESPTVAVLELPPLTPGAYDLYLFNESRELAKLQNALTVEMREKPAQRTAAEDKTVATARLRSFVPADVAGFPKVGDVDTHGSPTASGEPDATVLAVRHQRVPSQTPGVNEYVMAYIDVRVPVSRLPDGLWSYKGQRIRVGESMAFGTPDYYTQGIVIDASIPPGIPWPEQKKQ